MSFAAAELEALIPRLRRYARALARDAALADDLVQDALERAWTRRRQWQAGSDLRAWVFAILHNVFMSDARRLRRAPFDEDMEVRDARSAHEPAISALIDLEQALARLPADQRALVLLVGLEEMSYREAADTLAIPIGTVMSRLARGRTRLHDLMDEPASAARRAVPQVDATAALHVVK